MFGSIPRSQPGFQSKILDEDETDQCVDSELPPPECPSTVGPPIVEQDQFDGAQPEIDLECADWVPPITSTPSADSPLTVGDVLDKDLFAGFLYFQAYN